MSSFPFSLTFDSFKSILVNIQGQIHFSSLLTFTYISGQLQAKLGEGGAGGFIDKRRWSCNLGGRVLGAEQLRPPVTDGCRLGFWAGCGKTAAEMA